MQRTDPIQTQDCHAIHGSVHQKERNFCKRYRAMFAHTFGEISSDGGKKRSLNENRHSRAWVSQKIVGRRTSSLFCRVRLLENHFIDICADPANKLTG